MAKTEIPIGSKDHGVEISDETIGLAELKGISVKKAESILNRDRWQRRQKITRKRR